MNSNDGDVVSNLLEPVFIQYLIKKLKTGNLRGSHLNCLPGKSRNRISLFDFKKTFTFDYADFLKNLTEKTAFSLRINIPPVEEDRYEKLLENPDFIKAKNYEDFKKERVVLVRRLNNISYDLKNEIQEYGTRSFGFGYPTVAIQDPKKPEKILFAPLIIWYLELKQDSHQSNNWILSKSEDSPVVFNQVLFNYLKESHGVSFEDFKDIQEQIMEDGVIDVTEMAKLISLFEKKLNQGGEPDPVNYIEKEFENYQNKDAYVDLLQKVKLKVINNGTFAFYRTFKESIIQDMENLLKNLSSLEAEVATSYQYDFFSAVSTDPSQSKLLESLGSEKNILVQGPPGTGKSQSLTAILTNALKNKARCLVVCEKKTATEILYSNLQKLGLGSFAVIIDDPIKDRNHVVEQVRDKIEKVKPEFSGSYLDSSFETEFSTYKLSRKKLENHHRIKNSPQLNQLTRQDLIGLSLQSESSQQLLDIIGISDFDFSSDKYREVKSLILQFDALSSFMIADDPLRLISNEFTQNNYANSKQVLVDNSSKAIDCLEFLISKNKNVMEVYKKIVNENIEKPSKEVRELVTTIINHYESLSEAAKQRIIYEDLTISVSTKILASITQINREILLFKRNTQKDILKINSLLKKNKFFNAIELDESDSQKLQTLLVKLYGIIEFCDRLKIEDFVNKHIEEFEITSELFVDSEELSNLLQKINEYEIYVSEGYIKHDELEINSNTRILDLDILLPNKRAILGSILHRSDYFHEYYSLLKFIQEQDIKTQALLVKFLLIPRELWSQIFDQWFMIHYLSNNNMDELLKNDQDIRSISRAEKSIRNLYPKIIQNYWNSEIAHMIRLYNSKPIALKSLYNLRGANGHRRNSLRTILNYDFTSFSTFFPIVLTNPSVVSSILPLKLGLFDVVIFDEASQLRIEDTLPAFIRGKIHVVSGDKYQMPPSSFFISDVDVAEDDERLGLSENMEELEKTLEKNHLLNLITSESLLEFADQLHFKQVYLDIHYRSKHPDLIEFSNKAFYGSRLVPTPPLVIDHPAIKFHEVNGVYQSEDQTNKKECDQVIKVIKEEYLINPQIKLGVATFNLNQRNLILDQISAFSAKDEKFALMMNNLDQNGFFVKNLENIQGDERDVIIISTTFGEREDKSFIQNFGPLTRKGGYRLLNVIITRAKVRLHLITSIPEKYYSQYDRLLNQDGKDGKAIFYSYLVYAKAVSNNDLVQKETVLRNLSAQINEANLDSGALDLTESPFEEEVYQRMTRVIPKEKIHLQQKVGGFRLDIVLDTKGASNRIVIECDGATYHRSEEDHYWDVFRQEYLEQFGYTFHRIWSENWFEDAESEMRKLISFVKSHNGYLKE